MIAIITYSDFPTGTPGAIRYATFAQTYVDMGFEVVVLNKSYNQKDGTGVQSEAVSSGNKYSRYFLFSYRVVKALRRIHITKSLDGVIIGADVMAPHAAIIQFWCRSRGVKCIFDVTEWYSKEQFARWQTAIPYWEKNIMNKWVIDKKSRVIAISSYLYDYFKGKGCKVVNIPIIHNEHNECTFGACCLPQDISADKLCIIYAGSHLLMDNIPLIIKAISLVPDSDRTKIKFVIYGLDEDRIKGCVPQDVWETAFDSLCIMGRRLNKEVVEAYSKADFSVVLRDPSLRVNKAGFPSKVVESMRIGGPVICNYSSDLERYLVHNDNSIIVRNLKADTISQLLQELVHMPISDRQQISRSAKRMVQDKLRSQLFEDELEKIIS